jgi:hypothetical protein
MKITTASQLFFLEYAIRKVQENQLGLKCNGTHQLLPYAGDVNLLEDNIDTIKKNTETLIDASKHTLLSHHRNVGQNWDMQIRSI